MKPLRVAIIHPFLFRYARGIERFTFNLANALSAHGVEMHLLTWRWQPPAQIDALDPRVRVHTFPTSRYYAAKAIVPFYAAHLLRHTYDFVWIYFADYGESGALTLARQQRFGVIFHYPNTQVPHRYREFQRTGLAKRAVQLVSVSRYVADGVRELLGRDSAVIHHGVDTKHFAPDPSARSRLRESLGLSADASVLLSVAALEERKGVQWVLRSLPRVLCEFRDTMYLVLGDGPYRSALEKLTRELGVEPHVRFLGARSDIAPFYQVADVSLVLARGEASSLAALESLACGVPVVAAQQPPFDELLADDYGSRVNETDENSVASAIIGLLCNPAKRKAMAEAGRERIQTDFTWERVARDYLAVMNMMPGET